VLELAADEFRRQMDVNVIESIIATQAFGPLLGSEPSLKGKAGADRDDQLGGRQGWQPAEVGLFSLEAREIRY
jgi:NAD(P)-dependent dehydrogenase (short-subunit alcohol dehydrogenase family)